MKAIVKKLGSDDGALELVEQPTPEPGSGEVRVAVKSAGVNPVDWKLIAPGAATLAWRVLKPFGSAGVGMDFAGIVESTGRGVKRVKRGDPVVGATRVFMGQGGSYADTVVVSESQICPLPEGFDLVAAGGLPIAGVTAWNAIVGTGRLKRGQRALVLGASGGVGHMAVQIAKHVCGGFTVGVCSSRNAEFVRSLGADEVVDYTKGDALSQARAFGPYQVVVDAVGEYSPARCRELLAPGGRHAAISPHNAADAVQAFLPPFKTRMIMGIPTGAALKPLVDAIAADRIKVVVSEKIPLADAAKAHALSQSGRVRGKIVLIP
jgi:NADPH:quinone reductase-like Zn-dependent oxidoreductase